MTRYTQKFLSLHFSFHTASSYSDKYLQQVDGTSPPTISRSGQPIRYSPPTNYPLIGYDAPTLADVTIGKKRKMSSTKKTAQKTHGSSSQVLTITLAPDADAPTDATPPRSEGNKWLLFPLLTIMQPLLITLFGILRHSCRRYRRGKHPRNCFSNIPNSSGILIVHPPFSSIHLTFVFSNQVQRLPSKRARTTASLVQVT